MKSLYFGVLLILLLVTTSYAQRHIKGQSALSFSVGLLDNQPTFSHPHAPGNGYIGTLDNVWYRTNERYWKAAFTYGWTYYLAASGPKPTIEHYWLSVDYVPRGYYTTRRWLYIAPTAGLFMGYESVNRNHRIIDEGLSQHQSRAGIGPQIGMEAEVYVGPSLAVVGGLTERFNPFSDVTAFRTIGYVGIRYCYFR